MKGGGSSRGFVLDLNQNHNSRDYGRKLTRATVSVSQWFSTQGGEGVGKKEERAEAMAQGTMSISEDIFDCHNFKGGCASSFSRQTPRMLINTL